MSEEAPALYLSFAEKGAAVVARVLDWSYRAHHHEQQPRPLVALEVPQAPGAWDQPHVLSLERLRSAVVSPDPETARTAVELRLVAEWAETEGGAHDPDDDPDPFDLEEEAS